MIRASAPAPSARPTEAPRLRSSLRSAPITRASISPVTPGIEATRTPASVAARRASVWEIDWIVGATTMSAASIAAATAAGGSAACDSRSEITASVASPPSPWALIRSSAPSSSVIGLQITSTSSDGFKSRQSRISVLTALSRALPITTTRLTAWPARGTADARSPASIPAPPE